MASINKRQVLHTHEGGRASRINPELQLRRSVMACFLWEKSFYESGEDIASRIATLVPQCDPQFVAELAIDARTNGRLRHVPLLLVRLLAKIPGAGPIVKRTLPLIIQRADELTEFLAIYWKDGRQPLSAAVKKGLAKAFEKFDAYQLAKYNREGEVRLRDVLFLCHATPGGSNQAAVWGELVRGELPAPDTWEVALSAGGDHKVVFERLLREEKLGYMALLRNLRNMATARVEPDLVTCALVNGAAKSKALPFRYVAAMRAAPEWQEALAVAMGMSLREMKKLPGRTLLLVDVSWSMSEKLSSKSDLRRDDTAGALAVLLKGVCEEIAIVAFGDDSWGIPDVDGAKLVAALKAQRTGTRLGTAVRKANEHAVGGYDRIIVITDEQSRDSVPAPTGGAPGYMINVSTEKNGIGYGQWVKIDGFSESVIEYVRELETRPEILLN